jgi:diaminohydroxyphosphoribosylaminopyrimidine deaminase / 5-amino-6-(5-phosphoribosylamino)uracil reductase
MNELFMQRCIELAESGPGLVAPNPMVGAVLVHDDKIIGEGFHRQFGEAHAEVIAINNAIEKHGADVLKKSALYVSLEPCIHQGKTPPCCDMIIAKQIPEIIIGCKDSFEAVNGKGIQKLKDAGCKIVVDVLAKECRELNKRFFTFHEKKRPYVILKFAQSLDGVIAVEDETEDNRWISNEYSRKLVHKWRSEEGAMLVGANTAMKDNPQLNVRDWMGRNPVRLLIDRDLIVPAHLHLFDRSIATIVFNEKKSEATHPNLEYIQVNFGINLWKDLLTQLYEKNIQSIIIEGGGKTLQSVIDSGLWDEARIFTAKKWLGAGIKAPLLKGAIVHEQNILDDTLIIIAQR